LPSTHRNNCGFYFYLLEILKELCLCLRCWPHQKYVYMHSTQGNTNISFLDHFNGPSEHSSCKFLLGVFIAVLSIAALSSEHVWPFLANSRTFDVQRISMIFQCAIPYFDWIFSFDHACVFLELYKHYLARKCWTYIRRQGVLNSCCKGPLVIKLQVRFVMFSEYLFTTTLVFCYKRILQ